MGSKTRLGSYCTKRANDGVNLVTSRNINTRLARPISMQIHLIWMEAQSEEQPRLGFKFLSKKSHVLSNLDQKGFKYSGEDTAILYYNSVFTRETIRTGVMSHCQVWFIWFNPL